VELVGIVTYGTPSSPTLRTGVCGPEWAPHVVELNRLCCESVKNLASILVGRSLRLLPQPTIVVSYADTAQGHVGYVYQATNFLYTGLSLKNIEYRLKSNPQAHGTTITDKGRGHPNPITWLRQTHGDDFYTVPRPQKHRYVHFCGDRRQCVAMRGSLRYPIMSYPKGESMRYQIEVQPKAAGIA